MIIDYRPNKNQWIAEVWTQNEHDGKETYPEEMYVEINQWCIENLKYHARTAYHIFEFKKRSDLDWFLLRWQ